MDELTHRLGMTLRAYVDRRGWAAFRSAEKSLVQDVCRRNGWVVSTGGGVVLDADNVTAMRDCGRVIWLQASPGTIQKRLAADPQTHDLRPPLSAASDPAEIRTAQSPAGAVPAGSMADRHGRSFR
jgi:shikimate kinase